MRWFLLLAVICNVAHGQIGDGVESLALEEWQAKRVEEGKPPKAPVLSILSPKVGEVGILPYSDNPAEKGLHVRTSILQILDADSLLLTVHVMGASIRGNIAGPPEEKSRLTVMVKGTSTANLADDQGIRLKGGYYVAGTESYETANGKRTVHVLTPYTEPLIPEAIAKAWEANQKANETTNAQAEKDKKIAFELKRKEPLLRTWKTKDGAFSVSAYFMGMSNGKVKLERFDNGKAIEIESSKLSADDLRKLPELKNLYEWWAKGK